MKKTFIPLALIATLALSSCGSGKPSDSMSPAMTGDHMMTAPATGAMSMEPTAAMTPDGAMSMEPTAGSMSDSAMAPASYVSYKDYMAAKEKFAGNKIVLFFNASWCPACRSINEALTADPSRVPTKTTLVSVDYDQYTDLRQQYGVTMQHTFVELDAQDKRVRQWASTSVEGLLKELQG